ncbi:MAG: hypothetical protein ABIZ69_02345 [Ilumatobacteraceae bacterium]
MKRLRARRWFVLVLALFVAAGQEYAVPSASVAGVSIKSVNGSATASQLAVRHLAATQGGRPFGATSPWNTPTPGATKWFDTGLLHTLATPVDGSSALHWWVNTESVGVFYTGPGDPVWTFHLPVLDSVRYHRVRPATTVSVQAPANMIDGGDVDHVVVLVSGSTYYEAWNADVNQSTRTVTTRSAEATWAIGDIVNGQGAGSPNNDGSRASNFSWAGGLITGDDLARGLIDHALVVALNGTMLKGGSDYVFPATAWEDNGSGPIKMGSRIGIPATVARPAGLTPLGNMVFDALQHYGAFVGDYGGGPWPQFYADKNTVTQAQVRPLFAFWEHGGSSDMEKIIPLLRVADYQP